MPRRNPKPQIRIALPKGAPARGSDRQNPPILPHRVRCRRRRKAAASDESASPGGVIWRAGVYADGHDLSRADYDGGEQALRTMRQLDTVIPERFVRFIRWTKRSSNEKRISDLRICASCKQSRGNDKNLLVNNVTNLPIRRMNPRFSQPTLTWHTARRHFAIFANHSRQRRIASARS